MVGISRELWADEGLSISVKGDTGYSRLAFEDPAADATEVEVTRTRAFIEARYSTDHWLIALEVGARHDDGDGESTEGGEVSTRLAWSHGRWRAGVATHLYDAESPHGPVSERGVRAALGMVADDDGTGLAFALSPAWGDAVDRAMSDGILQPVAVSKDRQSADETLDYQLDGSLSWGFPVKGIMSRREILRPYAEFSARNHVSRLVRTGLALDGPLELNLAVDFRTEDGERVERGVRAGMEIGKLSLVVDRREETDGDRKDGLMIGVNYETTF